MSIKCIPYIPEPNMIKLWFFLLNYIKFVVPGTNRHDTNKGFWILVILRIQKPKSLYPTNNNFG